MILGRQHSPTRPPGAPAAQRLTVDWTACRGRGVCSELLPERVALDEWGYPLIDLAPVEPALHRPAAQAVAACPLRALRLQPDGS